MLKRLKRLLHRRRKNSGFTLVELVISCALLGILMVGVTSFIGPVLKNAAGSETNARATLLSQTMDEYVNRSIRDSYYVAIFTNAERTMTGSGGLITVDENLAAMKTFADTNSDVYELKCMSFIWTEDTLTNEFKYMLMNEKFMTASTALETISGSSPSGVFDDCFYDGLFLDVGIEQLQGTVTSTDEYGNTIETTENVPATKMTYTVYTEQGMDNAVFVGVGYTEFVNVRADSDENAALGFKFYPIKNMGSTEEHPDIYIYYVARKPTRFDVTTP